MSLSPAHHASTRQLAITLTHVELTWIEKKIEHWLRFGRHVEKKILDRRRSIVSFAPNSIFAFVRWASNDYGTIISRMDIVRAVETGERSRRCLSFVRAARSCCVSTAGRRSNACCGDRHDRGARHRSCRRRAGILASPPQPSRRRPRASRLYT